MCERNFIIIFFSYSWKQEKKKGREGGSGSCFEHIEEHHKTREAWRARGIGKHLKISETPGAAVKISIKWQMQKPLDAGDFLQAQATCSFFLSPLSADCDRHTYLNRISSKSKGYSIIPVVGTLTRRISCSVGR